MTDGLVLKIDSLEVEGLKEFVSISASFFKIQDAVTCGLKEFPLGNKLLSFDLLSFDLLRLIQYHGTQLLQSFGNTDCTYVN